ncbi:MAG TPA: transketolase [Candidatus Baltobacteraceae bacterium]|nr:transketolase [Candidatus Baltobacteraceae bacterium]
MPNTRDDEQRINAIRFLSVDAVQKANSGHPGMPLGAAATAYTIWTKHLRFNPKDPSWPNRDRFILSAGHASMLLYSLLYLTGYDVSMEDLKSFRQLGSKTPGHPEAHHTPGVEVTTGPLGQGVGNSVGMAIAEAHLAATYNRDQKIVDHCTYVMASDGDMMEGVSSEAASMAGHLQLGKLIVFYDDNNVSLAAKTEVTFTEDVVARFQAYRWHTEFIDIHHGNDVEVIDRAITQAKEITDRPSLIVVRTHIGYGSPKQDSFKAHGEPLGPEDVKLTKEKLGWPLEPDFYVPDDVLEFYRQAVPRGAELQAQWQRTYDEWKRANGDLATQFERVLAKNVPQNLPWPTIDKQNGDNVATRETGGMVMNAIAAAVPELVGGSADLDPSTKTYLKDQGDFQPDNYAGRNIHYGVREHAMAAINNGLALHGGLLPFGATFLNFLDYMKGAVRLACINKVRCYYVLTHDSVFLGEDGPTHQPIEHLAHMRATPNLMVVRPADSLETLEAWKLMIAAREGPWALILSRQKLPYLGDRRAEVARGAYILVESNGTPDLILIATGSEVSLAVQAAALLKDRGGIDTRVVSMPCWELFEAQDQAYRDQILPPDVTARMSIEAAATFGWSRWVGPRGYCYGIDHFGTSAPAAAIAKEYGFTPEHIAQVAQEQFATVRR